MVTASAVGEEEEEKEEENLEEEEENKLEDDCKKKKKNKAKEKWMVQCRWCGAGRRERKKGRRGKFWNGRRWIGIKEEMNYKMKDKSMKLTLKTSKIFTEINRATNWCLRLMKRNIGFNTRSGDGQRWDGGLIRKHKTENNTTITFRMVNESWNARNSFDEQELKIRRIKTKNCMEQILWLVIWWWCYYWSMVENV